MKREQHVTLPALIAVVVALGTLTVWSQSDSKVTPFGELLTNGRFVLVNGAPAGRGSTVFNGSEIQTEDTTAFINILSGGGVLSIAPGSRVKITRRQARIIAEVLQGSVTVRSRLASTVIAPDRVIQSEPNNLYTVSVLDSGTKVESLLKSVKVAVANGVTETIAAQAGQALTDAVAPVGTPKPAPVQQGPVTDRGQNCFVDVRCQRIGTRLEVRGEVTCGGTPVAGVQVQMRVILNDRTVLGPFTTTTNATGDYFFDPDAPGNAALKNVTTGGIATVQAQECGDDCAIATDSTGNRCQFL